MQSHGALQKWKWQKRDCHSRNYCKLHFTLSPHTLHLRIFWSSLCHTHINVNSIKDHNAFLSVCEKSTLLLALLPEKFKNSHISRLFAICYPFSCVIHLMINYSPASMHTISLSYLYMTAWLVSDSVINFNFPDFCYDFLDCYLGASKLCMNVGIISGGRRLLIGDTCWVMRSFFCCLICMWS